MAPSGGNKIESNLLGGHSRTKTFPKVSQSEPKDAIMVPQVVPTASIVTEGVKIDSESCQMDAKIARTTSNGGRSSKIYIDVCTYMYEPVHISMSYTHTRMYIYIYIYTCIYIYTILYVWVCLLISKRLRHAQ